VPDLLPRYGSSLLLQTEQFSKISKNGLFFKG
jgi:hypothetical protein